MARGNLRRDGSQRAEADGSRARSSAGASAGEGRSRGIYHSHTHAPPVPSRTDVVTAFWTDAVYVILGRFNSMQPEPVARAYRIGGGTWREEPLEVV